MGGWKQKSGWIQILPDSGVPFTFPFLSHPSVCLIVSRVRAYLTTDQQSCLLRCREIALARQMSSRLMLRSLIGLNCRYVRCRAVRCIACWLIGICFDVW